MTDTHTHIHTKIEKKPGVMTPHCERTFANWNLGLLLRFQLIHFATVHHLSSLYSIEWTENNFLTWMSHSTAPEMWKRLQHTPNVVCIYFMNIIRYYLWNSCILSIASRFWLYHSHNKTPRAAAAATRNSRRQQTRWTMFRQIYYNGHCVLDQIGDVIIEQSKDGNGKRNCWNANHLERINFQNNFFFSFSLFNHFGHEKKNQNRWQIHQIHKIEHASKMMNIKQWSK